jgi:hypothetical protein
LGRRAAAIAVQEGAQDGRAGKEGTASMVDAAKSAPWEPAKGVARTSVVDRERF